MKLSVPILLSAMRVNATDSTKDKMNLLASAKETPLLSHPQQGIYLGYSIRLTV